MEDWDLLYGCALVESRDTEAFKTEGHGGYSMEARNTATAVTVTSRGFSVNMKAMEIPLGMAVTE
jgi:hypothetical protein